MAVLRGRHWCFERPSQLGGSAPFPYSLGVPELRWMVYDWGGNGDGRRFLEEFDSLPRSTQRKLARVMKQAEDESYHLERQKSRASIESARGLKELRVRDQERSGRLLFERRDDVLV